MSSRVCLIIYDLPVYISSCLFSLRLSGLLVIPGVSCLWVLPCPVLSCPVLSCPVLSCPVLSCPVLSCPVLSCPVLSCPVLSCPVLSCPVLSCHVLPWCVIKYYNLSLYPRLRVPVPPSCVHRDNIRLSNITFLCQCFKITCLWRCMLQYNMAKFRCIIRKLDFVLPLSCWKRA